MMPNKKAVSSATCSRTGDILPRFVIVLCGITKLKSEQIPTKSSRFVCPTQAHSYQKQVQHRGSQRFSRQCAAV